VGWTGVGFGWFWGLEILRVRFVCSNKHKDHSCNLIKTKGWKCHSPKVLSRTIVAKFNIPKTNFCNFLFFKKFPGTKFANFQTPGTKYVIFPNLSPKVRF
jgi:hypothetical protein